LNLTSLFNFQNCFWPPHLRQDRQFSGEVRGNANTSSKSFKALKKSKLVEIEKLCFWSKTLTRFLTILGGGRKSEDFPGFACMTPCMPFEDANNFLVEHCRWHTGSQACPCTRTIYITYLRFFADTHTLSLYIYTPPFHR